MTSNQRGKIIGRIVSALRIANIHLNKSNSYRNKAFSEFNTFVDLAFMSDKELLIIDGLTFR